MSHLENRNKEIAAISEQQVKVMAEGTVVLYTRALQSPDQNHLESGLSTLIKTAAAVMFMNLGWDSTRKALDLSPEEVRGYYEELMKKEENQQK